MANNDSHGSPRDITRLIVGLLFGSGISGLAIGMIQGAPDVRPWGMAIFVLCLIAAGVLFWFGESVIERQERRELRKLGEVYSRTLDTIVELVAGYVEEPDQMLGEIEERLRDEIDNSLSEDAKADWVKEFRERTLHIIKDWEKQDGTFGKKSIV